MVVIEDNYNKPVGVTKVNSCKIGICENCDSKFQYDNSDIEYREFGIGTVICPCCNKTTDIDDVLDLTSDNVKFPEHFYHFEPKNESFNIDFISKAIKDGIKFLKNHKSEWVFNSTIGDTFVDILKIEYDKEYIVRVAKGYYETSIPFSEEDYK